MKAQYVVLWIRNIYGNASIVIDFQEFIFYKFTEYKI